MINTLLRYLSYADDEWPTMNLIIVLRQKAILGLVDDGTIN